MSYQKQHRIATIVKEKRKLLGYTQKEVSEMTNISIRSIQRIEKGTVVPRMYTLKTLATALDFSLESLNLEANQLESEEKTSNYWKLLQSIFYSLIVILLSAAFVAQSSNFPETNFEGLIYATFIVLTLGIILMIIWQPKNLLIQTKPPVISNE